MCYSRCIFQLNPIKSLIFCNKVIFYNLLNTNFSDKQVYERQLTGHFKTANSVFLSNKLKECISSYYETHEYKFSKHIYFCEIVYFRNFENKEINIFINLAKIIGFKPH